MYEVSYALVMGLIYRSIEIMNSFAESRVVPDLPVVESASAHTSQVVSIYFPT
jgi:hypothetical protein